MNFINSGSNNGELMGDYQLFVVQRRSLQATCFMSKSQRQNIFKKIIGHNMRLEIIFKSPQQSAILCPSLITKCKIEKDKYQMDLKQNVRNVNKRGKKVIIQLKQICKKKHRFRFFLSNYASLRQLMLLEFAKSSFPQTAADNSKGR